MKSLRRLVLRVRNCLRRREYDGRLREEVEEHLALLAEENIRAGMSAEEARRQAKLKFGSVEALHEKYHAVASVSFLDTWMQDLRYAARMMVRFPGFTATAILTLALGIGANTAIFSVVNAMLLRPLPYHRPNQLVVVSDNKSSAGISGSGMSYPSFLELRKHIRVFSAVAGLQSHALTMTGRGEPADMSTISVTPGFFSVLGMKPLVGRTLEAEDGQKGAPPVAVLSEDLWRSRFGADPGVVGSSITLDQRLFTIVGVMPADFHTPFFYQPDQVWIPLVQDPLFSGWIEHPPSTHWMRVIGRLRANVSFRQARAAILPISKGLASAFTEEKGWELEIRPLQQVIVGSAKLPLLLLLCAVGLVLLIACANIANLLLTRATARSKEIAVRIALGASNRRIARQLLTENAMLGLLGGAVGVFLAWRSIPMLVRLMPPGLPQVDAIGVNGFVLGFALAVSIASSLVFGLAPVLYAAQCDPQTNLKSGTGAGETAGSRRARRFLATTEVALAAVLLVGAGLLLRSFDRLLSVHPGFETKHVTKAEVSLPRYQYSTPEQWSAFANELMTRIHARPGLEDSAIAAPLPILDGSINLPFTIAGNPPLPRGGTNTADYVAAGPHYFHVMGISLIRGRVFSADDTAAMPPVAVISETLARRYFPHENPLGRHLIFGFPPNGNVSREIVGVVADVHDRSLARSPEAMMYVPYAQAPFWGGEIVVRSGLSTLAVASAIREETHSIDKNLPVTDIESFPEALHASLAVPRFRTVLLGGFGILALLLAAIGIYGVVSFSVSRRTREIGVRMTLGATPASVRKLVLKESAKLVVLGLSIGLPAALFLTRFLSKLLFGVAPADPLTFAAVALVLTLVTLAAAYLPARRASRVNPMAALRCE